MTMNFGELTFRKGNQPIIGLPLETIDKVGTVLTERYHKNRNAASKIQENILNLPDSNSEENKRIIQDLNKSVKDKFTAFSEKDNWFDADETVYKTAEELMSNQDVKDLMKYNSQYSRVEKEIDDSKAPEYYKQIRRMKNQALNKGIRNEKGEAQQYQGRAISGDLDISKYIKTANDLITGWKADVKEYSTNPSQFSMDNASDGFKMSFNAFGKTRIEQVSEDEVRNLVYSSLASDPKYNAEITELAELDLFAATGKSQPDEQDITSIMIQQAQYSPDLYNQFIISSPEFTARTKGMTPKEKQDFIVSLNNDPTTKQQYLASGVDQFTQDNKALIGNDPDAYSRIYTHFKKQLTMQAFEGLIDKAAYNNVSTIYDYKQNSLDAERYKKWAKDAEAKPMIYDNGMINKESVASHLNTRNTLLKEIDSLQIQLQSPTIPDARKNIIKGNLASLKAKLNANDIYTESIINSTGLTKEQILDKSKKEIIQNTFNILPYDIKNIQTDFQENINIQDARSLGYNVMERAKKSYNMYSEKMFNIISKNLDRPDIVKSELLKNNIKIDDNSISKIIDSYNNVLKNNTIDIVNNFTGDIKSQPIIGVGYLGNDDIEWMGIKKHLADQIFNGTGTMNYITSSNAENIGTNTLGKKYTYIEPSGKDKDKVKNWDISIEPVIFDKSSPKASNLSTFQVTLKNPVNPDEQETAIMSYEGNPEIMKGYFEKTFKQSVNRASEPTESFKYMYENAAFTIAGAFASNKPIIGKDGKPAEGLTLGSALDNSISVSKVGTTELYPSITTVYGNTPITIVTSKNDNDLFSSKVYKGTTATGEPWITLDNAPSKTAITQLIGANELRAKAGDKETYDNITRMFNLSK